MVVKGCKINEVAHGPAALEDRFEETELNFSDVSQPVNGPRAPLLQKFRLAEATPVCVCPLHHKQRVQLRQTAYK